MPILLRQLIRTVRRPGSWALPVAVVAFVFVTGWLLMALAAPNSRIVQPEVYWWWFLITASTVGYGDFYPKGLAGHLVGGYVVLGGIATLTTVFTRIAELIENARGIRMQGLATIDLTDHVVILGYAAGRTERVVDELVAKNRDEIVLCAWEDQVAEHPMSTREQVRFLRGDLVEDDVLRRACLSKAAVVLVDARDDNEAVPITVAANHVAPGVHTVVALRDLDRSLTIRRVDPTVRCVQWHSTQLIAEEIQDPGISLVYNELMTEGGGNTYSVAVPDGLDGRTFGDFQQALGPARAATLLAYLDGDDLRVSPRWDTHVPPGALLYFIADERIGADDLTRMMQAQRA